MNDHYFAHGACMKHVRSWVTGQALLVLFLLAVIGVLSSLAFAQTISIPSQTITVTIPAQTVTLPVQQPPVDPVPSSAAWGYHNGLWSWAGDFTQLGTSVNYHDTSSGIQAILFTSRAKWGLYLPYFSANFNLPNPGWTKVTLSLRPTITNQVWSFYFVRIGDIPTGCIVNLTNYGPAPVMGKWATYTVPLADVCVAKDSGLYKFGLQDQTGLSSNLWYLNDIGFLP